MKRSTIITVGVTVGLIFLGGAMFAQNVSNTGPESNNQVTQESNQNCQTTNNNQVNVNNQNNQNSTTGNSNNQNNTNTGSSSTGSSNNSSSTNTNVNVNNNNNCASTTTTTGGKGAGGAGSVSATNQVNAPNGSVAAGSVNLESLLTTIALLIVSSAFVAAGFRQIKRASVKV